MSRADRERRYDTGTRLSLVEGDLDDLDEQLKILNDRLAKILWTLVGLLVSVATACILLALNLVVGT